MKLLLLVVASAFIVTVLADAEISDAAIEQEFKKEDTDNSGDLSIEEVEEATRKDGGGDIPPEVKKLIEDLFKKDDTDGNGKLSLDEVKARVKKNLSLAEAAPDK